MAIYQLLGEIDMGKKEKHADHQPKAGDIESARLIVEHLPEEVVEALGNNDNAMEALGNNDNALEKLAKKKPKETIEAVLKHLSPADQRDLMRQLMNKVKKDKKKGKKKKCTAVPFVKATVEGGRLRRTPALPGLPEF